MQQSTGQIRQAQDVDAIPTLAWPASSRRLRRILQSTLAGLHRPFCRRASEWGWAAALHTEDRDKLLDFRRRLLASGEAGEIEARLRRYDGKYRWFLFRIEPVYATITAVS
jgi:PAS domain-containing protein